MLLTTGRKEINCYNSEGGIRYVYLANYINHSYAEIVGEKGVLLESIPTAFIYRYNVINGTFTDRIEQSDDGVVYNQELKFSLKQQNMLTTKELNIASSINLRYIVEFNNGDLKIGGLYNGANITGLEILSGGSKADFNGYNITITGKELYQSAFIQDLDDAGFVVYEKPTEISNFILQSGDNYIFNNNDNYVLNDV